MKYYLKRDFKKVVMELTFKKELTNHIVLEDASGNTYKIKHTPVAYNKNVYDLVSTSNALYSPRFYYIETVDVK